MKHFGLAAVVFLAGCVSAPPAPYANTFDAGEVAFIHKRGTNTLLVNAFLKREQSGGVVHCAGERARLVPKGAYSAERMERIYGTAAARAFSSNMNATAGGDYSTKTRRATTDIDGRFAFRELAAGSYFVITDCYFSIEGRRRPGSLMAPVTFAGSGEVKSIVLTATIDDYFGEWVPWDRPGWWD